MLQAAFDVQHFLNTAGNHVCHHSRILGMVPATIALEKGILATFVQTHQQARLMALIRPERQRTLFARQ